MRVSYYLRPRPVLGINSGYSRYARASAGHFILPAHIAGHCAYRGI